ncbi:MAG: CvpA family protein [Thermoanaerobaculales bacterium]|jgi:uncharacterized membrane protein required for colicin V production|nr:CvpA family protein [Thermoanaerobaculales bacterium]
MTVLDWVLVVVWAGITLGGFFKGAVRIVFGLGGAIMGIWLAVVVGPGLSRVVAEHLAREWLAVGLAYLIPFTVVSLLCMLAGWGMEKALEGLKLGCLNRLFGAVLAGAATAAVLALLLVSAVKLSPELAAFEERSVLLARVDELVGYAGIERDEAKPQEAATPSDSREERPDPDPSSGR